MSLMYDPLNMIVSGVGGQGNILASDLISRAFCDRGYFVSVGETYGATQRGGTVFSHIRLSREHLYGPLIPLGEGHIIIGFEPLEVYRILRDWAHEHNRVVMNDRPFYPLDSLQKKSRYPTQDQLISAIDALSADLKIVKGTRLAKEAGHPQSLNVVMVGAFSGLNWVPLEKERFLNAIGETFSGSKLEMNQKAFELGFEAVQ